MADYDGLEISFIIKYGLIPLAAILCAGMLAVQYKIACVANLKKNEYHSIAPHRVILTQKDVDPNNEGLEALLTIDGKKYILKENKAGPLLIAYMQD